MIEKYGFHRKLIIQLVTAAVCIAVVLTALVLLVEFRNIDDRVADQAVSAVERWRMAMLDNLDAPGLGDHAKIRQFVEKSIATRRISTDGYFVFVRVLDKDFHEVAQFTDLSYEHIRDVNGYLLNRDHARLIQEGNWRKIIRLGNKHVIIDLGYALKNSAGSTAGYAEGIYVISPGFLSKASFSALFTALSVAGIVLLTALILYPIINRLLDRVSGLSESLIHANLEILNVLGSAIAKRDNDTDIHNYRVTIYAIRIAQELHLEESEIRTLIKGSFLHDVGKIGIRDSILLKPAKLTDEEFEEMKKHVSHGLDIVSRSAWLNDAAQVVGNHHEKFDGTGYLNRTSGTDIPRVARIFAIADVFDALTSKRPYKEAFSLEETIAILKKSRGSHFDPEILDVFLEIAPGLYQIYANRDDEKPREDLKKIGLQYYGPDTRGETVPG
jgi:HD-GYP domain-containing protein (c-di-GMP phosphodiesterase class II)